MAIYAISDLHLGFAVDKSMDRFGPQWIDHPRKVAEAWQRCVGGGDTVLVCGDTSWAMRLEEARPDLEYVAALPGRKILLRGNHDYWWGSLSRLRQSLPTGLEVLQHDSFVVEGWSVCGSRGWMLPAPDSQPRDVQIYERELGRLRLSLETTASGLPKLAMLHYPPYAVEVGTSAVLDLLVQSGVTQCVYGHLHAVAPGTYPDGEHAGIRFHCVSADMVDFAPKRIA